MTKTIILRDTIEWNIAMVKDIIKHPEQWGSGTKEDWEKKLQELEGKLKELGEIET